MNQGSRSERLADYTALALGVLVFVPITDAAVVYSDIDPDIYIDTDGNYYALDMDGNGTGEIQFLKSTFSMNPSFTYYYSIRELIAGPFSNAAIAGESGISSYNGFTLYFPYAVKKDALIDVNAQWQDAGMQFLGWVAWTDIYDAHCYSCNWNNQSLFEVLDHYIAIRFLDEESKVHYGWIRCDVLEDGNILVLKDKAFETEPDHPIKAGASSTYQKIGTRKIEGDIYSSGNTIYIKVPYRPTEMFNINIYNKAGQIIYSAQEVNPFIEIQLDAPKGIYIAQVISGYAELSEKILLE